MKTDLLKEAIADADALKKLAIENAKASLNETFDSKIKSMLAAKLQEESDYDELEEADDDLNKMEEKKKMKEPEDDDMKGMKEPKEPEEDADEAFDIDAILAEMDGEEEEGEEEEGEEEEGDKEKDEAYDKHEQEEADEAYGESSEEDEGMKEEMDEEIDLDEILAELKGEKEEGESKEGVNEEEDPDSEMLGKFKKFLKSQRKPKVEQPKTESIELQEIKRQAAELAKKVNETNLINAKLLYLNKVLHKHNLSEQQKVRVVAAFDKANTVKEAKIIYESLTEALNIKVQSPKNNLQESLGFASKASGISTKREIISEADTHVARWQFLAGIKK